MDGVDVVRGPVSPSSFADLKSRINRLDTVPDPALNAPNGRNAAVIVPLVDVDGDAHLLITHRSQHLTHHAGQISFPGGRIEPDDASPRAAALRETHEELGIPPEAISVVTSLAQCTTGTGFEIAPFVGLIETKIEVRPDPYEVANVTSVAFCPETFARLLHEDDIEYAPGQSHRFWVIDIDEIRIWGATARILKDLVVRLTSA